MQLKVFTGLLLTTLLSFTAFSLPIPNPSAAADPNPQGPGIRNVGDIDLKNILSKIKSDCTIGGPAGRKDCTPRQRKKPSQNNDTPLNNGNPTPPAPPPAAGTFSTPEYDVAKNGCTPNDKTCVRIGMPGQPGKMTMVRIKADGGHVIAWVGCTRWEGGKAVGCRPA